jgi:ribosomal protein S17E
LIIDERKRIFLPDFGNIEIKLRPLEKTLYFFYLKHPEGVGLSFLRGKREELYEIYTSLSSIGNLQEMKNRIDEMTDITSNSAAEKISKIKKAFVKAIGEELAKNYYIQGGNGEVKKVVLDRGLVVFY